MQLYKKRIEEEEDLRENQELILSDTNDKLIDVDLGK